MILLLILLLDGMLVHPHPLLSNVSLRNYASGWREGLAEKSVKDSQRYELETSSSVESNARTLRLIIKKSASSQSFQTSDK